MEFSDMDIRPELIKNLSAHDIKHPTEIQARSIPVIMTKHDVLAESETGSGKTLAFAVPMIEELRHQHNKVQAIIICPTRELAKQVAGEFDKYTKHTELRNVTVYGGVGYEPQINAIPESDIVIGTPGRVLDLMEKGALNLESVRYLVLDEADRMLDMGFIDDIKRIIDATPEDRQTLLFSATINYRIEVISREYMREPIVIRAKSQNVRGHLFQGYYVVNPWQKISLIHQLMKNHSDWFVIIFCRTIVATDHVASELSKRGIKARALNGAMSQAKRESTIKEFADHKFIALVATDVAARGLQIDKITHIFNYDLPDEAETYVHRVGRTARQKADGEAITLLSEDDYRKFDPIMNIYDDEIEKLTYHAWGQLERIPPSPPRPPRGAGRGGPRNNRYGSGRSPRGRSGPRSGSSRGPPRRGRSRR